ncbi:hypothetical protein ACOSQ4_016925 [Xanthoceras sorbifolium]
MATLAANSVFVSLEKSPPQKVLRGHHGNALPWSTVKKGRLGGGMSCLAATTKTDQHVSRPIADFPSNIWKHFTLDNHFTSVASRVFEFDQTYSRQMEQTKHKVKEMLIASANDPIKKVSLINLLCRLGVSYHFEVEINEQLNLIFEGQPNLFKDNNYDLCTVALLFRIFRQRGFKISCDVFDKFTEGDGKFKENLSSDATGLLSLYEASNLRTHEEDILDEAVAFSSGHLKSLVDKCIPHLAKQITMALEMPLHKGIPRLEALQYISLYEEDEFKNQTLLLFAKLDFNRVQLVHQEELSHLTGWWRDLDLASKLPYTRERLIECYFWVVSTYFEPCYTRGRLIYTKVLKLMSVVDDIYDAYGNIEELRLFTDATERWNISAVDDLPEYTKDLYSALLNTFAQLYNDLNEEERSYGYFDTRDRIIEVVKAYHLEAEWLNQNYVPTLEEYLSNGVVTAHCYTLTALTFLGITDEIAAKNAFQWLRNDPKLARDAYAIIRILDDIASHEFEQKRQHVASAVECYIKQYGASREEAVGELNKMVQDIWKSVNEECMKPAIIPIRHLNLIVNNIRLTEVTYKDIDGYTNPDYLKTYITKFFIDPMPI